MTLRGASNTNQTHSDQYVSAFIFSSSSSFSTYLVFFATRFLLLYVRDLRSYTFVLRADVTLIRRGNHSDLPQNVSSDETIGAEQKDF